MFEIFTFGLSNSFRISDVVLRISSQRAYSGQNPYAILSKMWPFNRKKRQEDSDRFIKRLVAGIIIGGAIGSVIGKKLMDKQEQETVTDEEEDDDEAAS